LFVLVQLSLRERSFNRSLGLVTGRRDIFILLSSVLTLIAGMILIEGSSSRCVIGGLHYSSRVVDKLGLIEFVKFGFRFLRKGFDDRNLLLGGGQKVVFLICEASIEIHKRDMGESLCG
jgi:hypothetical protein